MSVENDIARWCKARAANKSNQRPPVRQANKPKSVREQIIKWAETRSNANCGQIDDGDALDDIPVIDSFTERSEDETNKIIASRLAGERKHNEIVKRAVANTSAIKAERVLKALAKSIASDPPNAKELIKQNTICKACDRMNKNCKCK